MERFRAGIRASTITKEQLRRRMTGPRPKWIDLVDPIKPTAAHFLEEHFFRCPADTPRISRRWVDRSYPRTIRSHQSNQNRMSPLAYHTFENRFGRFKDLAWKVSHPGLEKIWTFLSTLKLPTQGLLYTDAIDCVNAFTSVINMDQCPRRLRRKRF
ncbi:probable Rga2 protein [Ustilago bromivora]|uniref:Probable Rga2 protein n=1 Tax=Ustilago bromivora TaxID=307758 RepID=A0A8H8QHR9_9BASI|nr:probable Rga2 protein [Ustilago bromivora]